MSALGVHRVVERQVVARGERLAVASPDGCLTYRELNQLANVAARHLMACGLRRGSLVVVKMERSPRLAVALLAVLKAGAAYMCVDRDDRNRWPEGIAISQTRDDETLFVVDPAVLFRIGSRTAPNLPIVTRPDDLACVLPQRNATPGILVPHATITALQSHSFPDRAVWSGDVGALDLWLPLMAGGTVAVVPSSLETAAA